MPELQGGLRTHGAQRLWHGIVADGPYRAELITSRSDDWTRGRFRPDADTLTFRVEGPRYGFRNVPAGGGARTVAAEDGWTRVVPSGSSLASERPPGAWTYLLVSLPAGTLGTTLALEIDAAAMRPRLEALADALDGQAPAGQRDSLHALLDALPGLGPAGAATGPSQARGLDDARLRRVLGAIEAAITAGEDAPAERLAAVAGLRRSRFSDAFQATMGIAPHAYLAERRLQRARRAVETGTASLTAIAHELGFSSSAHFSTAFRARFGQAPGSCRRAARPAPAGPAPAGPEPADPARH